MAMNLQKKYDQMWDGALKKFKQGRFEYDLWLNAKEDKRYGITLLARPDEAVKTKLVSLLDDFRRIEPHQYYYPASDMHLTVMSIISCREGFSLSEINPDVYIQKLREALTGKRPFPLEYRGLTASPGSILAQGFPVNGELNRIREDIRHIFKNGLLPHSIDSRYRLETAHATLVRFREKMIHPEPFIEQARQYRATPIGTFMVDQLELVFNDWYQRAGNTIVLEKFVLSAD